MQGHSTTLPLLTAAIRTALSAMLQELQKNHKSFRNLEALVLALIRQEHSFSPVWSVFDGTQPLIRALRARLGGKV
jgi:hypothetical protein